MHALQSIAHLIKIQNWQRGTFITACILYALFSSPTPDNPGLIEAIIALLLITSIKPSSVLNIFSFKCKQHEAYNAGRILLFFGIIAGTVGSLLNGSNLTNILRDVIPFIFMLLPLFYWQSRDKLEPVLYAILIIGVCFSLRSLIDLSPSHIVQTIQSGSIATSQNGELLYLANMPTVLFAAIYLTAKSAEHIYKNLTLSSITKAVLFFCFALPPIIALITSLQRASLSALIIALLMLLFLAVIKSPTRTLKIIIPTTIALILLFPALSFVTDILSQKTENVGLNMRQEEFTAVWTSITTHPLNTFFGLGWGATFESPAVGNIEVNFTHSLLTSMMLKTGLIGLSLTLFYLYSLGKAGTPIIRQSPVIAIALLAPVLIDILLYASFKSFDFGLVLCLIPAHRNSMICKQE